MIARLQQVLVLLVSAALAIWLVYWIQIGQLSWAALGIALVATGHGVVLALEYAVLAACRNRNLPRPSWRRMVAAWWAEALIAPAVFCWRQPFRATVEADHLPADSGERRGVILVHGYLCNRGFWNPWMRALREQGTPFIAVNLEPPFGSIDLYAATIDAAFEQLSGCTRTPPVIVGHSMGGLAIRAWLRGAGTRRQIHRAITIGSPHHGAWLARFSLGRNGRQMRQGSDWLKQLEATESVSLRGRFTCFYSELDNVVFPAALATLADADNRAVPGAAHVQMAFKPVVFAELAAQLAGPADTHR